MDRNDVGAVIARAAELKQQREDQLTPDQLREVGAELGIEAQFVDEAVKDLQRRHEERAAQEQATRRARAARHRRLVAAFVAFDLVVVGGALGARAAAEAAWADVEAGRAAVAAALVRQRETAALFATRAGQREADAELAGALNRVAIARGRYDEAANAWNARGPWLALGAMFLSRPARAALSSERTSW